MRWPQQAVLVLTVTFASVSAGTLALAQTGAVVGGHLDLTPAQRSAIFHSIAKQVPPTPPPADMRVSVGGDVPPQIELYNMPEDVVADAPGTKIFKYTVVQNQVVVVDPTNMKVVDIIRP
jgi:hypothetical protein